jgi:hypothetical protein
LPSSGDKISTLTDLQDNQVKAGINSGWKDILKLCLSFEGSHILQDAQKLKMFANNCYESYQEYGHIKEYSEEELKTILFYFGKKYEDEKTPPTGSELKFILFLINKVRES